MNKRVLTLILTLVILCATLVCAGANESMQRLYDQADMLTDKESSEISLKLDEISEKHEYDVLIISLDSFEGLEPAEMAEAYYTSLNFEYEDVVFMLISMEENNRECWIFPYGEARSTFTDDGIDYILYEVTEYLAENEFAKGFDRYITLCSDYIIQAEKGEAYNGSNLPKEPFEIGMNLLISIVIGFVIAFIVVSVMKGKLKSVRSNARADDYLKQDSLRITNSGDYFLYRTVTRTKKAANSTKNGGVRTSVSGSSSGRGRSF